MAIGSIIRTFICWFFAPPDRCPYEALRGRNPGDDTCSRPFSRLSSLDREEAAIKAENANKAYVFIDVRRGKVETRNTGKERERVEKIVFCHGKENGS